MLVAQTVAL